MEEWTWQYGMNDNTTVRVKLSDILTTEEIKELGDYLAKEFNALCRKHGEIGDWVAVLHDPGYEPDENSHMGSHVLINSFYRHHQEVHIDGVGHRAPLHPHWSQSQVPMSAALFLSEHRGTQFGEVYPVADRFESMLDGDIKLDDFVKEVDEKLDANKTFLDLMLERNAVGKTRIGTVYVFPKNFQFHRGLARGPNPKEPRLVLYFTFVRASRLAEYEVDKMETAEITVGFANGKFGLAGAWMWVTQFYVALEVP